MSGCLKKNNLPSRLKLIFDAMLKTFAANFHRGQYETVADEVSRITDTFARFETVNKNIIINCTLL